MLFRSLVRSQHGFTVDPVTGETITRGFPVAFKAFEQRHLSSVHPRHFSDYKRLHAADFGEGMKLGGWALIDPDTEQVVGHVLDVVEVFDSENYLEAFEAAVQRGIDEDQDAIFDLVNFEEIDLRVEGAVDDYRSRLSPDGSLNG